MKNTTCLLRSKLLSIYHFIATYIHYRSKYPKEWKEWESRRWKKTNSATLRENLTFKLNSVTESVDPQISSQQQLQNNGKFPN